MRKKLKIYIVLTLCWSCIIFSFSLQPAETSSQLSSGVGFWLIETFLPGVFQKIDTIPEETLEFGHFLLRKTGHFSEYFILGVLSLLTLFQTKLKNIEIKAIVYCLMVASIDETIQLFVSGRSGQVTDVILDSVGALAGIILSTQLQRKYKK